MQPKPKPQPLPCTINHRVTWSEAAQQYVAAPPPSSSSSYITFQRARPIANLWFYGWIKNFLSSLDFRHHMPLMTIKTKEKKARWDHQRSPQYWSAAVISTLTDRGDTPPRRVWRPGSRLRVAPVGWRLCREWGVGKWRRYWPGGGARRDQKERHR